MSIIARSLVLVLLLVMSVNPVRGAGTDQAHDPNPADGAQGVLLDALTLNWTTGVDPLDTASPNPAITAHELWLSPAYDPANPPGPFAEWWNDFGTEVFTVDQGAVGPTGSKAIPGLEKDALYYWAVDELLGAGGRILGETWSFETELTPVLEGGQVKENFPNAAAAFKLVTGTVDSEVIYYDGDFAKWGGYHGGTVEPLATENIIQIKKHNNSGRQFMQFKRPVEGTYAYADLGEVVPGLDAITLAIDSGKGADFRAIVRDSGSGTWYFSDVALRVGDNSIGDHTMFVEDFSWHAVSPTVAAQMDAFDDGGEVAMHPLDASSPIPWGNWAVDGVGVYFEDARGNMFVSFQTLILTYVSSLSYDPIPGDEAVDVDAEETTLGWTAGTVAVAHDVYFGTDAASLSRIEAGSTAATYEPGALELGQTYYWRIDDIDDMGVTHTGSVWSFTVGEYVTVDNMESDPLGWTVAEGATIAGPETTVVNSGTQALPLTYNNAGTYSEATLTLGAGDPRRDWTQKDVKSLSISFHGSPPPASGFTYNEATETYTVTGGGIDFGIGGEKTDDAFHFVYDEFDGANLTVVAKVNAIEPNTLTKPMAGVMMRDSLGSDSATATVFFKNSGKVQFQYRTEGGTAMKENSVDLAPNDPGATPLTYLPCWLRLEKTGNKIAASYRKSLDEEWASIGVEQTIDGIDPSVCLAGLALSAGKEDTIVDAVFSDVSIGSDKDFQAHDPTPADGAQSVPVSGLALSWLTGLDPNRVDPNPAITGHFLWLSPPYDPANPPEKQGWWDDPLVEVFSIGADTNPADGSVDVVATFVPPALEKDAFYYWVVDESLGAASENDVANLIFGDTWSFETETTGGGEPNSASNSDWTVFTKSRDVGIASNIAQPLYVKVTPATGSPVTVNHPDPNASLIDDWTEWNIALSDLGIANLANISGISLGLAASGDGGSGTVYFDDIRLYITRCFAPDEDLDGDCDVDFGDLAIMAGEWLNVETGRGLQSDISGDDQVDLVDFSSLADAWGDDGTFPAP